jgi:acetyl-CoA acetyltransferase
VVAWPLRSSFIPPVSDGAAAVVLTAAKSAVEVASLAFGSDHHDPTRRVLGSESLLARLVRGAATEAGIPVTPDLRIETTDRNVVRHCMTLDEMSFSLQEILANPKAALSNVNVSGGLWASNPPVAAGLERVVHAARFVETGQVDGALAHSSYGAAGQGQFVCALRAAA